MSIPAVATRLSSIEFPSLMSVMICWAIGRMIAARFDSTRGICLGSFFFRLDRSCLASWILHSRVSIAQQLLIDCARYQRMIVRTRSYPMHCTLRHDRSHTLLPNALYSSAPAFRSYHHWKNPCDDVVKCCTFDIIK